MIGLASCSWPWKVKYRKWGTWNDAAVGQALRTSAFGTSVCSSLASWKRSPTWDDALGDVGQGEAVPRTGGLDDGSVVVASPCK